MCGGNKGQTTSTSSNAPPPQVMAEYEQIMSRANQVAGQPYQPYTGNMVAGFTPDQQAAFQTVQGAQGIAQPYFDQARGLATAGSTPLTAADINQYYNPYQTNVIDATQKQFNLLNAQQQAQLTGSALGSGGLFNDRFGVAQGELGGQQAAREAPVLAGLETQGFTQAAALAEQQKQAEQQGAYTFGNLGTANLQDILSGASAQLGTGGQQQQFAQENLNWPYAQYLQKQSFPYQQTGWLAGVGTGVGSNMGGTSTTTTQPPASNAWAPYLGLGMAVLSDRHAKRNVHKIGTTKDGQPIYRFQFHGSPQWHVGLIAQEVEKKHPEAVHDLGGLKHIDVKRATDSSARGRGGGIDRPHFQAGGAPAGAFPFGSQPMFNYAPGGTPYGGRPSYFPGGAEVTHWPGPPKPA